MGEIYLRVLFSRAGLPAASFNMLSIRMDSVFSPQKADKPEARADNHQQRTSEQSSSESKAREGQRLISQRRFDEPPHRDWLFCRVSPLTAAYPSSQVCDLPKKRKS